MNISNLLKIVNEVYEKHGDIEVNIEMPGFLTTAHEDFNVKLYQEFEETEIDPLEDFREAGKPKMLIKVKRDLNE